jgi:hypothetical protein
MMIHKSGISFLNRNGKRQFSDEKCLRIIAGLLLMTGVIVAIVLAFTILVVDVSNPMFSAQGELISSEVTSEFNPKGLLVVLSTLLSSLFIWSFLRVISNISITLKSMKEKMDTKEDEL